MEIQTLELNKSMFLLEQLNLEGQPTEQQIMERAEQLEIDDLQLAKNSLTMLMSDQWKPYCNRYKDIFYINLMERKAYADHPIDMYFKQQYARKNHRPIPQFQSFEISQIAQSLELIDKQILKVNNESINNKLNIVYQQSEEHQQESFQVQQKETQLNEYEIKQLEYFQKELRQEYKKYKKEYENKKEKQIQEYKNKLTKERIDKQKLYLKEYKVKLEGEIQAKNELSLINSLDKHQNELKDKFQSFTMLLNKQIQLRRNIASTQQDILKKVQQKHIIKRIYLIKQTQNNIRFQNLGKLTKSIEQLKESFHQQILRINGTQHYQKSYQIFLASLEKNKQLFNTHNSYNRYLESYNFAQQNQNYEYNCHKFQAQYQKKLKQIQNQIVWNKDRQYIFQKRINQPYKNLTLKLWKKTL